jgi:hypothetical protein
MRTSHVLHVDSRHRVNYPNTGPNHYRWDIGKVLRNCDMIEVIYVELPGSMYNVPSTRNQFAVTQSTGGVDTKIVATVSPGNYDSTTIVTALNTAWTSAGGTTDLTFAVDSVTDQITATLSGSATHTVSFDSTDWAYPFSWHYNGALATPGDTARAGGMLRLNHEMSLFLAIPETGSSCMDEIRFSPEGGNVQTQGLIGRYQMRAGTGLVNYFQDELGIARRMIQHCDKNMRYLTIRWLDGWGEEVDFNMVDHSMLIRLHYNE